MKAFLRTVLSLLIYAGITLLFSILIRNQSASIFPSGISSPEAWQEWCQQSLLITGSLSFVLLQLYQIFTCNKLLGASKINDPNQRKIGAFNWFFTFLHFALTAYIGFWLYGYATCFTWLLNQGFKRYYIFMLPIVAYTVLFWLLSRTFSNRCVFRYKNWQLIR